MGCHSGTKRTGEIETAMEMGEAAASSTVVTVGSNKCMSLINSLFKNLCSKITGSVKATAIASRIRPSRFSNGSAFLETNRVNSPWMTLHDTPSSGVSPVLVLGGDDILTLLTDNVVPGRISPTEGCV